MKRFLLMVFGAVLLGAGASAEDVSMEGTAGMGFIHANDTLKWNSDFDVAFSASGTTNGGLTFGATASLKAEENGGSVGSSKVYISGEAWEVSIGDVGRASDMAEVIPDVGYDGLGVDDFAEEGAVGQTSAEAKAEFTLGNATLAVSTAGKDKNNKTPWAAGLKVDAGNMSFGADVDSQKLISAGVTASLGGIDVALYYAKDQAPADGGCADSYAVNKVTLGKPATDGAAATPASVLVKGGPMTEPTKPVPQNNVPVTPEQNANYKVNAANWNNSQCVHAVDCVTSISERFGGPSAFNEGRAEPDWS